MDLYLNLSEQFHKWEIQGRGTRLHPSPVHLEPPFVPFSGHRLKLPPTVQDGSRPTLLSQLAETLFRTFQTPRHGVPMAEPEPPPVQPQPWEEPSMGNSHELQLLLPPELKIPSESMAGFLFAVSDASAPITLELMGTEGRSTLQLAVHDRDAGPVAAQVRGHFPEIMVQPGQHKLRDVWGDGEDGNERVLVEFGLSRPFMLPLADLEKADPFVGLTAFLSTLTEGEAGIYQVSFLPTDAAWGNDAIKSLSREDGSPVFDLTKEQVKGANTKMSRPLYAVAVRLAAKASELDRAWEIIRRMAASLRLHSTHYGNALIPLTNDSYDEAEHSIDFLHRRYRRCGMILNQAELIGFIRLPGPEVRTTGFARIDPSTRALTDSGRSPGAVCLGLNEHAGTVREVWVSLEQRVRHTHIIGASGSGKTNLLLNLIRQDIEAGTGFALLDPHGDLVDRVMEIIPEKRREDVVIVDPSDEDFIVPFNFLSAHSEFEKTLLASDLVAVFRAQSTSWGDQMNLVFGNALRAFLESSEKGTLSDVRRFLLDATYREHFLKTVRDPDVVFYWQKGFPQLGGNKSIGPILTRLETFLSPKPIRYMVSQRENRLDFGDMMDRGKIFLARLPQGQMGKENSHLLGSLIIAKLQQMAMSRQRLDAKQRRPFFVYADEFQNFICPSMAEILSGARKYGLGFILAHQDLRQLDHDKEVASAVLSNAFTRVVFRVGDSDARSLADGFAHFPSSELQNLPIGHAICRVGQSDNDFNLKVSLAEEIDPVHAAQSRLAVRDSSRRRVALLRAEVEAILLEPRSPEIPGSQIARKFIEQPGSGSTSLPVGVEDSNKAALSKGGASPNADSSTKPLSQEETPTAISETMPEPTGAGKGGNRHRLLQERIKAAGIAKGFRSEIEGRTQNPNEGVDVRLIRDDLKIACEVSVTTNVDHEFGNIEKCVRESFDVIAFISADQGRRTKMSAEVDAYLAPGDRGKVRFFSPDEVFAYIESLPDLGPTPANISAKTIQGWNVKRKFKTLSPEERAAKTKDAYDLLDHEMKLPPQK